MKLVKLHELCIGNVYDLNGPGYQLPYIGETLEQYHSSKIYLEVRRGLLHLFAKTRSYKVLNIGETEYISLHSSLYKNKKLSDIKSSTPVKLQNTVTNKTFWIDGTNILFYEDIHNQ